jgi:hypothetical protein
MDESLKAMGYKVVAKMGWVCPLCLKLPERFEVVK